MNLLRLGVFAPMFLAFAGCGASLDTPTDLPNTVYPAGEAFRITLVMTSCSDRCATYEPSECSVKVKFDLKDLANLSPEERVIELSPSVAYDRNEEDCREGCGGPVVAHCDVDSSLPAGRYVVKAGSFERTIELR